MQTLQLCSLRVYIFIIIHTGSASLFAVILFFLLQMEKGCQETIMWNVHNETTGTNMAKEEARKIQEIHYVWKLGVYKER